MPLKVVFIEYMAFKKSVVSFLFAISAAVCYAHIVCAGGTYYIYYTTKHSLNKRCHSMPLLLLGGACVLYSEDLAEPLKQTCHFYTKRFSSPPREENVLSLISGGALKTKGATTLQKKFRVCFAKCSNHSLFLFCLCSFHKNAKKPAFSKSNTPHLETVCRCELCPSFFYFGAINDNPFDVLAAHPYRSLFYPSVGLNGSFTTNKYVYFIILAYNFHHAHVFVVKRGCIHCEMACVV